MWMELHLERAQMRFSQLPLELRRAKLQPQCLLATLLIAAIPTVRTLRPQDAPVGQNALVVSDDEQKKQRRREAAHDIGKHVQSAKDYRLQGKVHEWENQRDRQMK